MTALLTDNFGRTVDYVRISVTDRCDFRCTYCMAEEMTFLPKSEVMSLEEIEQVARAFTALGVNKIRLTGGEPLVRRGLVESLPHIGNLAGLQELLITTNGSQLKRFGTRLRDAGVTRINISLDSLKPDRFKDITRKGSLSQVLEGIEAVRQLDFARLKINAVIMKGGNDDEIIDLLNYCRNYQIDISYIEEMPLGNISAHDRSLSYCSSDEVREKIQTHYPLTKTQQTTAGPSTYYTMLDSNIRVGFISPHSHNFCHLCNRVRVTVSGRLLLCLGNEHSVELLPVMRNYPNDIEKLKQTIVAAMPLKPEKHHFDINEAPQILRFMSATGG